MFNKEEIELIKYIVDMFVWAVFWWAFWGSCRGIITDRSTIINNKCNKEKKT